VEQVSDEEKLGPKISEKRLPYIDMTTTPDYKGTKFRLRLDFFKMFVCTDNTPTLSFLFITVQGDVI
jgi:hypothetical protein